MNDNGRIQMEKSLENFQIPFALATLTIPGLFFYWSPYSRKKIKLLSCYFLIFSLSFLSLAFNLPFSLPWTFPLAFTLCVVASMMIALITTMGYSSHYVLYDCVLHLIATHFFFEIVISPLILWFAHSSLSSPLPSLSLVLSLLPSLLLSPLRGVYCYLYQRAYPLEREKEGNEIVERIVREAKTSLSSPYLSSPISPISPISPVSQGEESGALILQENVDSCVISFLDAPRGELLSSPPISPLLSSPLLPSSLHWQQSIALFFKALYLSFLPSSSLSLWRIISSQKQDKLKELSHSPHLPSLKIVSPISPLPSTSPLPPSPLPPSPLPSISPLPPSSLPISPSSSPSISPTLPHTSILPHFSSKREGGEERGGERGEREERERENTFFYTEGVSFALLAGYLATTAAKVLATQILKCRVYVMPWRRFPLLSSLVFDEEFSTKIHPLQYLMTYFFFLIIFFVVSFAFACLIKNSQHQKEIHQKNEKNYQNFMSLFKNAKILRNEVVLFDAPTRKIALLVRKIIKKK